MHATALEAKVAAVNNAHRHAVEIHHALRAVFKPYVGTKILKADGTLLAKLQKLLPEFPYTPRLHVYRGSSSYTLNWAVKAMEMYPGTRDGDAYTAYYETGVYVGNLSDGVLTSMYETPTLRVDFTPEEILKAREIYRVAKQAADDAFAALNPFGEYDR